jgi:hypothetical protein
MCGLSCSMPPIHISPFFFIISSDATPPPVTSTKLIWPTVENVRARYYRLHSLLTPPSLALPILLCPAPSASTETTETPFPKTHPPRALLHSIPQCHGASHGVRSLAGYASGSSLPSPAKNFTPHLRRLLCKWQGCEVAGENAQ